MTELYFFIECFHSNNDDCGILGRGSLVFAIKKLTTHNFVTTLLAKPKEKGGPLKNKSFSITHNNTD